MRKLISIGIVLALLVTFVVPVAVGAQDCDTCGVDGPCPAPVPTDCGTNTVGGALLWTMLGTSYIMGRAVGDVTEHMAGTLGCFVDELAPPTFGVMGALMDGIGGLVGGLGGMLGMEDILDPIAGMLESLADVLADLL